MAPPQVNLNEKKTKEGWVDPMVVNSPVPSAPPIKTADIQVDFGTPVGRKRCSKRCKFIVAGVVFLVAFVIAAAVLAPLLYRRFAHERWEHDVEFQGQHAREEARTDGLNQRIILARDGNGRIFRMQAILDYSMQRAGYKNVEDQVCYLENLQETFQQGCMRWRGYRDHSRRPAERPYKVLPEVVDPVALRSEAGDAIAELCDGVMTYRVEALPMPLADPMGGDSRGDSHEQPPPPPPTPLPGVADEGDLIYL